MTGLREKDIDTLHALVEEADDLETVDEFGRFVVRRLPDLVPCDIISYNEIDPENHRVFAYLEPESAHFPGDMEIWERVLHEHPTITWYQQTGDGRALRLSDFVSSQELHRLDLYRELYSPMGVEYQIAITLPMPPPLVIGIAFNRGAADFDERDRAILNLARPHLARIHRTLEARAALQAQLDSLQQAIAATGRAVVLLDGDARPALLGDQARGWLEACFGPLDDGLPTELRAWLEPQRTRQPGLFETPAPAEPLVRQLQSGRLVVSYLPAIGAGGSDALVLERTAASGGGPASLLTPREHEVLAHVAQGKRSAEVAAALRVQPSTVHKHLERIYSKLGVSTRTAAVAAVFGSDRRALPRRRSA